MADGGAGGGNGNNEPNGAPERQQQNVPQPFNIVNIDIGNPFQHNPNVLGQNNIMNMRDRLFHAIYFKGAVLYAQIFPSSMRNALECFILLKAILFFIALVYIHVSFIKNPATCLQHVADWPRNGVVRVEIIPNLIEKRMMLQKYNDDQLLRHNLRKNFYNGIGPQTEENFRNLKKLERSLLAVGYQINPFDYLNDTLAYYLTKETIIEVTKSAIEKSNDYDFQEYIVEFALEYGYLRLSPTTRKRLRIPTRIVQLDPDTNKCFGDKFSKMLLRSLIGYDDLLMASVRVLAETEENKGYLRNVITGEHYRFVTMWWSTWTSYVTAFTIMTLFTFCISILLRFSHHQIFAFIVDLLQMLEFNGAARFPIAPLLTVILALVGMEAIMSEFFNDTTTAFYIIVIVWVADQYDTICCHTNITKRYWLRFFYLYLFSFYAYHYRFSGQNRSLALVASWLFIQHSMFFFFHRYELPVILQQARLIARQNEREEGTEPQQPQQQGQQRRLGASRLVTRFFGRLQQQQPLGRQQQQQQQPQQPPQQILQRRAQDGTHLLPLLRALVVRRGIVNNAAAGGGGTLEFIRRSLLPRGWITPVHVRVQVRNLQRIQIGSIQIPTNTVSNVTSNIPVNHNNTSANSCNAVTTSSNIDLSPTVSNNSLSTTSTVLHNENAERNEPSTDLMQTVPVIATDKATADTNILETDERNLDCKVPLNLVKPTEIVTTETVGNRKKTTGDDKNECKEQQQQQQQQKENKDIGKESEAEIKNNNLATGVIFDETTNTITAAKLLPKVEKEPYSDMDSRSVNSPTTDMTTTINKNCYMEKGLFALKPMQIQGDLFKNEQELLTPPEVVDNVRNITVSSEPNFKIDQLKRLNTMTTSTSTIPFMTRDKIIRTNSSEKLENIDNNDYKTVSHNSTQSVDSKGNDNSENNNSCC